MGIESQYLGEINIPEEHRAEYAQQALKLLRAGGMVTVEPVQLYGHKLYLLSPPECADRDQTLSYLAAYHLDELCSILPPLTDEDWEELKQSKMLTIQAIYD